MIALQYMGDGDFKAKSPKRADAEFVIGQVYSMEEWLDRSEQSHDHAFAWLGEAFKHLPEPYASQFPSVTHLRKRALIDAGFYNEFAVHVGSEKDALALAADFQSNDPYSVCVVRGRYVVRRTARSMKRSLMDKKDFQAAKQAILEIVAEMIGVPPDELQREAA